MLLPWRAPLIFIATNRLKAGALDAERSRVPELVSFVEREEPRVIGFNEYVNDVGDEVTVVQIHPDAASFEKHMGVIADHARRAYEETLDRTVRIQVFGDLPESMAATLREQAGTGVEIIEQTDGRVTPRVELVVRLLRCVDSAQATDDLLGERWAKLAARGAQLQRPPFHPKWKELAPRATVSGWTRFKAAQEWLDRNMPAGPAVSAASGSASPPPAAAPAAALAPQDRDPLYREFLEWRASRAKAAPHR